MKHFLLKTMLLLCALVVGGSAWGQTTFQRITSTSDLEVGKQYIIVSESNNIAMGVISNDKGLGVAVTINNNTITLSETSNVNILTLGGNASNYTLLGNKDNKYIGYNSSTKLQSNATASSNSYKWAITFNENNVAIANKATSSRLIRAYDSAQPDFRAYTTSNGSVIQLYKEITPVVDNSVVTTTTINATGITNTNKFISTTAGSLSASVVYGTPATAVPEASVTWDSSNDAVATIDATGAVTLVGAGTVTFTASYAGVADEYKSSSDTYAMTVIDEDPSLVVIWSEDFNVSEYSNRSTTYNYVTTNSSAVQASDNYAGGEAPEMMVKSNGTFSATIPLNYGYSGNLTMTYKTNAKSLTVSSGTQGISMSGTASFNTNDTHKVTFSGVTAEMASITIVFTAGGDNVRLDDIVLKGMDASAPSYNITTELNNPSWGEVSVMGTTITANPSTGYRVSTSNPYTVTSGTATVTQNGNIFNVLASSDCTVQINFEAIPSRTATFSVNGTTTTQELLEGAPITFPADPADINGKSFVGWVTEAISGTTNETPTFVTSATMGTDDLTYYAVFASTSESVNWQKLTVSEVSEEGTYAIITTNGYAFKGTINNSGHGEVTTNAFSFNNDNIATSAPSGTCEITFVALKNDDNQVLGYKMYNADKGYLYASKAGSGGLAWHSSEDCYWSCPSSSWKYSKNYSGSYAYLREYNNTFRTYSSTSQNAIAFAKKITVTSYSDYCTSITATATIGSAGYATYVAPFDIDFTRTENLIAYRAESKGEDQITLKQVEAVPSGEAVVLKGAADTYTLYPATESVDPIENLLKAATTDIVSDGNDGIYVLNVVGEVVGFYTLNGTLSAGKAYLQFDSNVKFLNFNFEDEEATGVELTEKSAATNNVYYNLSGQRVMAPTHGIYIVNGKKVYIK